MQARETFYIIRDDAGSPSQTQTSYAMMLLSSMPLRESITLYHDLKFNAC